MLFLVLEELPLADADGGFFSDITDGGCNVGIHTVPFSAISESKISM